MQQRARPAEATIFEFGNEFLVVCPRCSARAVVLDRGAEAEPRIRLTCSTCGYSQERNGPVSSIIFAADPGAYTPDEIGIGAPVDWYFHLPLWLQIPCCGETLWAYNLRHLAFIEEYVQADVRERALGELGWSNQSLRSRLPRWILLAKNREAVLRCISRLKERVQPPAGLTNG